MTFRRSACPIANVLDVIGDKWSLLVVRDIALGKHRFSEFLESPERISTNVLADRLQQLEHAGWITRACYQMNPPRHTYDLTAKGKDFLPVLNEILRWTTAHMPTTVKFEPSRQDAIDSPDPTLPKVP